MISSISQLIGRVQRRVFVPRSSPGGASRGWFGIGLSRPVHRQLPLIRQRADEFRRASDEQLRQRVVALRQQWQGFSDHAALTQGAALALEGFRRALGVELYDVQVEAGLSLTQRCVVEMQTGEGKTFTVGLAAFLCAAADRGVHVATTNAYLAARDCEQVRPVLELLGVSVAALPETHDDDLKHRAYLCDVTYGTGYDFGFDYLRDQVRLRARSRQSLGADFLGQLSAIRRPGLRPLQQRRGIALIDEADSVLIDEAAMPLVLSGAVPRQISEELYQTAIRTAESLVMDSDFVLEAGTRAIRFSESGWVRLHAPLRQSTVTGLSMPWADYVESSLRALHCLQRDVDYVVEDDRVQIVDVNTGRIHEERTWRGGLHQAVECKEGVPLSEERLTDGQISRQRYFQLYDRVAGITGTAQGNEREFSAFFGLDVRVVSPHRPSLRQRCAERFFATDEARNAALVAESIDRQQTGQPVLIGTQTIEHSLAVAQLLQKHGVPHAVLNGLQDEAEAEIVAQAGTSGTITVATSMAGRGTDIRLDPPALASGGLFVAAASHHFSPRVDRQLIGRTARQGQPGAYRFFTAATDSLIDERDPALAAEIVRGAAQGGECPGDFTARIAALQQAFERQSFDRRQAMVRRDQWLDQILESLVKEG